MNGATRKQVEKFKYLGVAFTSDKELDTRKGKDGAVMRAFHYSVVVKQKLKSMVPKRDKSILEHLRKRHFFVRGKLMMKK